MSKRYFPNGDTLGVIRRSGAAHGPRKCSPRMPRSCLGDVSVMSPVCVSDVSIMFELSQ